VSLLGLRTVVARRPGNPHAERGADAPPVQGYLLQGWVILIALMAQDSAVSGIRLGSRLRERYPGENTRGAVAYALTRSSQVRPLRMPRPQVARGERL